MSNISNESGIMNARFGVYKGMKCLFTHRNPKNGEVYGEGIPADKKYGVYGKWVPYDSVQWC